MASLLKRNEILNWKRTLQSLHRRSYRFPTYEVTLMRHGECEDDLTKQFAGWQDTKLSTFGVEQAKRAGRIMSVDETHYHIAYTSELARAHDTVKHVLEPLLVQPKVFATWRLNDRHYGDLTGYNRSQMALVHGERKLKQWMEEYAGMPPIIKVDNPKYKVIMDNMNRKHIHPEQVPRTESLLMVYNRVLPYWENIIVPSLKMRNKVIIIAHNDSLCAVIKRFAELNDREATMISLPPAIPFTFTLDNHMHIIKGKDTKNYVGAVKPKEKQKDLPQPQQEQMGNEGKAAKPKPGVHVPMQFEQHLVAQQYFNKTRNNKDTKSTTNN